MPRMKAKSFRRAAQVVKLPRVLEQIAAPRLSRVTVFAVMPAAPGSSVFTPDVGITAGLPATDAVAVAEAVSVAAAATDAEAAAETEAATDAVADAATGSGLGVSFVHA